MNEELLNELQGWEVEFFNPDQLTYSLDQTWPSIQMTDASTVIVHPKPPPTTMDTIIIIPTILDTAAAHIIRTIQITLTVILVT